MESEDETPKQGTTRRPAEGVRVAVAQIAPKLGDTAANLEKHREAIERARDAGARVVVFPELSLTGYRLKDSVPEVALTREHAMMAELAGLSEDVAIVVGFVEETREHHFFNSAAWFENGRFLFMHRKSYLPTYGMFDEQRYFARGKRIRAFDTQTAGRAALLVCEDMLHPTAVTIAALDGADTIYTPSASPVRGVTNDGDVDANGRYWESYIRTLSRAVGVFVVYANRVGVEDGHTFWGGSEIVAPDGTTLAKAAYYDEDLISAVLPEGAIRHRRMQFPALRDEDVDLTINELERIRERVPRRQPEQRREGPDRRRDDDSRRGRYARSGYDQRGPGGGRDRDRRSGWQGREDRNRGGNWQPRDDQRNKGGNWQPREDRQPRGRWQGQGHGNDARDRGRAGGRWFPRDDSQQPRSRYRPEPGERKPRPLGGPPQASDDKDDEES